MVNMVIVVTSKIILRNGWDGSSKCIATEPSGVDGEIGGWRATLGLNGGALLMTIIDILNRMYEDRGQRRDFEVRKSNKIYVSNLSSSTSEDELRKVFGGFGPITDVSLKHKETISFAFIEFTSIQEAEAAMSDMNGKSIGGQEIKVQFARGGNDRRGSFGDRGRGRPYGDRGGYQNRDSYGDRPPRRDFGDRPRGCFNCGEEGHMIKDCPKPRKPREFNNTQGGFDRSRNYGEGSDRYDNKDSRGSYQARSYGQSGRSYGESRGGSGGYSRGGRKHSSDRSRSRSPKGRSSPKGRRNRSPSSSRSR